MRVAEPLREQWFALDADLKRALREPGEREYLAGNLEHGCLGTKRKRLRRSGEGEAVVTELSGAHHFEG